MTLSEELEVASWQDEGTRSKRQLDDALECLSVEARGGPLSRADLDSRRKKKGGEGQLIKIMMIRLSRSSSTKIYWSPSTTNSCWGKRDRPCSLTCSLSS